MFRGYYTTDARMKFLEAALQDEDTSSWEILVRDNAASLHPSDFDVIKVSPTFMTLRFKFVHAQKNK